MESAKQPDYEKIINQSVQMYLNLRDCSDKNSIESFSHRLDHLHQIKYLCIDTDNSDLEQLTNRQIIIEKQNLENIHGSVILSEIIAIVSGQNNMIDQAKKILEN